MTKISQFRCLKNEINGFRKLFLQKRGVAFALGLITRKRSRLIFIIYLTINCLENQFKQPQIKFFSMERYSDKELQEFKEIIERKLSHVKEDLEYLSSQLNDLNESALDSRRADWVDDSSMSADKDRLSSMYERQQKFYENLKAALLRIENKTYGVCTVTGKLIDKRRLKVVPHATKSVEAKLAKKR